MKLRQYMEHNIIAAPRYEGPSKEKGLAVSS
jgi:hypothetical protein